LELLLDSPNIASKRWVYEQYDSTVQASTVLGPGGDAGVLRVPGTDFGLAVTVDCNSRLVALDPYEGGKAAVAEAARNVACTGARPLGITDCLNFGNPEKPEVFFQFREACRGIADACRAFATPVTGGNVSFYNESPTGAVDPTPTIGMVGLLERVDRRVPSHFAAAGDDVLILGTTRGELGGSAYWSEIREFVGGRAPPVDLEAERRLQELLVEAARRGFLRSAHDAAEGGLLVTLAEAAIGGAYAPSGLGAELDLEGYAPGVDLEGLLYGEDAGRVVLSADPASSAALAELAQERSVPIFRAGRVGGRTLELRARSRGFSWDVETLRRTYFEAIPRRMQHADAERSAGE
jgi:phosphoribosylformylglycinamidine synthase